MPNRRSANTSRTIFLPGAHRTIKRKPGAIYVRYCAWRGGPSIGNYVAATEDEAEAKATADASGIAERYSAARSSAPSLDTVAGLIDAFERSTEFKRISESTKAEWSRIMLDLRKDKIGAMPTIALKAKRATAVIERWHGDIATERGPRAADYRLQVIRRALAWNVKNGNIEKNPALGIAEASNSDRSDLIWEAAMIEKYRAYIRAEIERVWLTYSPLNPQRPAMIMRLAAARDALTLILNTGARREDASVFARAWIDDGAITYTPRKGARRARTAKRKPRVVVLPVLPDLARFLTYRDEAYGASSPWLITSSRGGNYTPNALGTLIGDTASACEIERSAHDGKGTFVTLLKTHTDFGDEEIAQLVDWSVVDVQNIIRKYVSAKAVADALRARFRLKTGT